MEGMLLRHKQKKIKDKMRKFNIHTTEEELQLIEEALEFYSRMGLLQFERLDEHSGLRRMIEKVKQRGDRADLEIKVSLLKALFGYQLNAGPGIFNEKVHHSVRQSMDISDTIKNILKGLNREIDISKIAGETPPTFNIIEEINS